MHQRVGFGVDVHRFKKGRSFFLGGVSIPYSKGLYGHSDADVLIHAIIDALLGAANLGDIGLHFPDTDSKWKDIRSTELLAKVKQILEQHQYKIVNIDSTICLEKPKIQQFIPFMKSTLAQILTIDEQQINIKATTYEKLGFVGNKKGIIAYAVCLIQMIPQH